MTVLRPNRGLLPFEFEVVHVPGRTLGVADYLSRHPTELQGASVKRKHFGKNGLL